MGMQIESSGITKHGLVIDQTGRALVRSTMMPSLTEHSYNGESFCISTGMVALTTTNYSGIFYVQNTSTRIMRLALFCVGGDVASMWWKLTRNPTGGTLLSGTVLSPQNINFSSGNVFPAISGARKGAEGATVTGGDMLNEFPVPLGELTKHLEGSFSLGQNNSLAFSCKPSAPGNVHSSMLVWFE
jgi:hypothetical protein